jgi:hypothetical protein
MEKILAILEKIIVLVQVHTTTWYVLGSIGCMFYLILDILYDAQADTKQ